VALTNHGEERLKETVRSQPNRPALAVSQNAYLVNIYPTGPTLGLRYALGARPLVIGRGDHCDILIDDPSVSRNHARIEREPDGYFLIDLGSTNGIFVNDVLTPRARLKDGDYLRIGNSICRFLAGDNVEVAYHEEIYRLTIIDALTGIPNKRYLLEALERELARSVRYQRPLALILFDLDRFKTVNDRFGHLGGDVTLRELAACVKGKVRTADLFARYGGEEFALVLPETSHEDAIEVAEQVRRVIEEHPFRYDDQQFQVTLSLGVASTAGEPPLSSIDFLRHADDKLYQAKEQGRNRVVG
jgi:diguanylate cyclase (GGDEF)-like protein